MMGSFAAIDGDGQLGEVHQHFSHLVASLAALESSVSFEQARGSGSNRCTYAAHIDDNIAV